MTSKRAIVTVAIIGIIASIIGGLVVYAAIAANLEIRGSAEFQPESWAVKFRSASLVHPTTGNGLLEGGARIQTAPTLQDTVIEDFRIILTQPGDAAAYTFWIENTGSLDAILSTYVPATPECVGTGATATADAAIVCGPNLTYTFVYIGGDLAENGLTSGQAVAQGDRLNAGTEVQVQLRLAYSSAATQLPTDTVTIGNLGRTLIFTVNNT